MDNHKQYLKPNVVVEPLVDQWYAWSHLISPATAAMNIAGRHLRIMDSYVKAPQVHAAAVKNPAMLGGPFVDHGGGKVEEITSLIARTKEQRAQMIEFAAAIRALDEMLHSEAQGYSLEPLYEKIPEVLRGYVELFYDLNNHPSFRVVEPLLYHSPYYDRRSQSFILSLIHQDDRPFMLSTPRLKSAGEVHLQIPFDHPGLDDFFKTKVQPQPFSYFKETLAIPDEDDDLFAAFLTPDPPPPYQPYTGEGVRWRYFGHACILIEAAGFSMLLDPALSYTYDSQVSRYTYQDLPDVIDYVLITHNHQDHLLFETVLQLRHKIRHIIVPRNGTGALQDPSLKLTLENVGFTNVIEMDELESIRFENGAITGLPFFGEHCDLSIRTKLAYLVRLGQHSLLFAADSCNIEPYLYRHLHRLIGDIDVLFLGMECEGGPLTWVYGPLLTRPLDRKLDRSRTLSGSNYERGIAVVNQLNCKEVYVYAMGQEPWLNYIMSKKYTQASGPIIESDRLVAECRGRGMAAERLFGEKEILLP